MCVHQAVGAGRSFPCRSFSYRLKYYKAVTDLLLEEASAGARSDGHTAPQPVPGFTISPSDHLLHISDCQGFMDLLLSRKICGWL
jgi:hypothetical protein